MKKFSFLMLFFITLMAGCARVSDLFVPYQPFEGVTKDNWFENETAIDIAGGNPVYLLLEGDSIGIEIDTWGESIVLMKIRKPLDFTRDSIIIEYKIKFYYKDDGRSHASINIIFDAPDTSDKWWYNPITDGGYLNYPVSVNYMHAFGPSMNWGGKVGISSSVEGADLPYRGADYPEDGKWVIVRVKLFPFKIITVSQSQNFYRAETTYCDLTKYKYFTPAFGDQHQTRVIVDKITISKF